MFIAFLFEDDDDDDDDDDDEESVSADMPDYLFKYMDDDSSEVNI